jgi:hypothetical protein
VAEGGTTTEQEASISSQSATQLDGPTAAGAGTPQKPSPRGAEGKVLGSRPPSSSNGKASAGGSEAGLPPIHRQSSNLANRIAAYASGVAPVRKGITNTDEDDTTVEDVLHKLETAGRVCGWWEQLQQLPMHACVCSAWQEVNLVVVGWQGQQPFAVACMYLAGWGSTGGSCLAAWVSSCDTSQPGICRDQLTWQYLLSASCPADIIVVMPLCVNYAAWPGQV